MLLRCTCLGSFVLAAILVSPGYGVVIGTWDNDTDGWIDWSGGQDPIAAPKYEFTTFNGSPALQLNQVGWDQNLSIKLQDNGLIDDFLANRQFHIDVTFPAGIGGSFAEIVEVIFNAEGIDWGDVSVQMPFVWDSGDPSAQTGTVVLSYGSYVDNVVPGLGGTPGWAEFIIATNTDGSGEFLFQNARLVIPEPTSIALLGMSLAGLALVRRRRDS